MIHYSAIRGKLSDLFVSVQGEGPFVGIRQVFVRFSGCNLNCQGCDTDFSPRFNVDIKAILKFLEENQPIHSVAITGGEPLLQIDFLLHLLPRIKSKGYRVYLETNATLPDAYPLIAEWIDVVSADVKLPSVWKTRGLWDVHRKFLDLVKHPTILFVKIVLSSNAEEKEFDLLVDLLSSIRRDMIVVLQPMSPLIKDSVEKCLGWQKRLMEVLDKEVRVIPQVHKFLEVR